MSEVFYHTLTKLAEQPRFEPQERAEPNRPARRYSEEERPTIGTGLKGAAGIVAGKKILTHGAERALGVHRLIHGTSEANADSILRSGFMDSYGASAGGSTANVGGAVGEQFQRHNKGRIHMFKDNPLLRRVAAGHAYLSEAGAGMDQFLPAILGRKRGGATVGAVVGDQFFRDNYERDPFHYRGAYRTAASAVDTGASNIGPERLTRGRAGLRDIIKHRERGSALLDYVKRDPRRFMTGLGMTAAGGLLAYGGGKRVYRAGRELLSRGERDTQAT